MERKKRQLKRYALGAHVLPSELLLRPPRIDPGSIVQMENRIKRLEAVIASSALDTRLKADSPGRATDDTPSHDSENLTDRLSTLMIDEEGSSNFLGKYSDSSVVETKAEISLTPGSASGLSMFSPQGLQWISERTGNFELPKLIKRIGKERQTNKAKTQLDLWYPLHESAREPLPPKHVADLWVRSKATLEVFGSLTETIALVYFETFNTMFPLYDWEVFEQYYTRHYSSNPPPGAAWFASINVVLGIGSLISEIQSQIDGRGQAKAISFQTKVTGLESSSYEKYVRNATSCFTELVFDQPSLMAVQALCGMVK